MPRRLLATRHASIVEPDADRPETHAIDGTPMRVFNVPRTIADCFRH